MVLPDNPSVIHPVIAPAIQPIVKVSGFDISGLRVSYDSANDILSIGIDQPPSQRAGDPLSVIAGDADNNGNDGTVNPAVTSTPGFAGFQDFPAFGQSEHMAVFLDLTGTGTPDIVAGFAQNDPRTPKEYQVAQAIVNPGPNNPPTFGTMLPQFTGNVYKNNSSAHPNLEFNIDHFSQLYFQETGKTLTPQSVIGMGAYAGSAQDIGISEAYFPEQTFSVGNATPPQHQCPPASPPVLINPHENRHINTAHPTLIRVSVIGTSGFDVTQINPATVTLGGAHPVMSFTRHVDKTEFLDETFIFQGNQVKLPPGITQATLTGSLYNGQTFSTSETIFNKDASFYSAGAYQQQQAKWAVQGGPRPTLPLEIAQLQGRPLPDVTWTSPTPGSPMATPTYQPAALPTGPSVRHAAVSGFGQTGPVISIPRREPQVAGQRQGPRISAQLQSSMNHFLNTGGAGAASPGMSMASAG